MFWNKIKSKEYEELLERIVKLESLRNLDHIDLILLEEKLVKAISRKVVKKEEEVDRSKDLYGGMFLPDHG